MRTAVLKRRDRKNVTHRKRRIEEYDVVEVKRVLTDPIPRYSTLPTNWITHHLLEKGESQRLGYKQGNRHCIRASRML